MSQTISLPLSGHSLLGEPVQMDIPSRSPNRPKGMVIAGLDVNGKSNEDEVYDDMSSGEFIMDGYDSPRDSVFSLEEPFGCAKMDFARRDSVDLIDCSEIDFYLDELLDAEVCQIDDLVFVMREHDERDCDRVKYVTI